MMSRITLTLKRRFAKVGELPYVISPISTLEWRAVARPRRVMRTRGRVQLVERAQGDTSMFAVVSHIAGQENTITSVAVVGDGRESGEIEMSELKDKSKESSESPV